MQLRQMDRVGLGGNISLVNQSVSLVFMVLVQVILLIPILLVTMLFISQVVIIAEWFLIHRPITAIMVSGQLQCDVSRDTFLLLHVYIYVLLLINVFCSVSVYNIQKNFNEGRWISLASLCLTPIFSLWPVVHYFTPSSFHDPTMAVTIAASAATLLATIFFPKLFTISAQSKLNRQKEHEQMMAYSQCPPYYPPSSPSSSLSSHSSHLPSYQMHSHSAGGSQRSQRKGGLATLYSAPQAPIYPAPQASHYPSWPPLQHPPEVSAKFNGLNFLADYYMGDTSLTLTRNNSRRPILFS